MDLRTLVVVSVLLSLLTGVAMAAVAIEQPDPMRGWLKRWAVGLLAQAGGWMLFALRGAIPDAVSVVFANTLILVGSLLLLQAIRSFYGAPAVRRRDIALVALQLAVSAIFLWVVPSLGARIGLGSLISAVVFAEGLALVWRHAPRPRQAAHTLMAVVQSSMLAVVVVRLAIELAGRGPDAVFQSTPVQSLLHTLAVLAPVLSTLAFALMVAQRLASELERSASRDALTGLANRRGLEAAMRGTPRRGSAPPALLGLLLVDVDHFKRVNDTFGHEGGDALLVWLAQRLREEARDDDVVVRHGGEEFVVLLPGLDLDAAARVGERLRRRVEGTPFTLGGTSVPVSVSIGVASADRAEIDLRRLLRQADQAMYRAKSAGRNRVEVWATVG